jgi:hypothetical protein
MSAEPPGAEQPAFQRLQYAFTRHLRDPGTHPAPPGIEDRRLQIYRDLLYRNVERFVASNFPVLRRITPDARWHAMVRDYFARHVARTPLFPKMAQEFLRYLESERGDAGDPDFIAELAHYEWVEGALAIDARELDFTGVDEEGDWLAGVPVPSPLAWLLRYGYPVHRIGPQFQPAAPPEEPTYLVVYRDRRDEVGFMQLNAVSARLVGLIGEATGRTTRALLEQIAGELRHREPQAVIDGGLDILRRLKAKDVVLGVRA